MSRTCIKLLSREKIKQVKLSLVSSHCLRETRTRTQLRRVRVKPSSCDSFIQCVERNPLKWTRNDRILNVMILSSILSLSPEQEDDEDVFLEKDSFSSPLVISGN